jgi:hypothetical protein
MASGHVNRVKRPNTWLHRPMLQNVKKVLANPEPSTHGTKRQLAAGRACPLCPGISDINLFRYCQSVIDFDAEIADRAFDFGMSEQELDSPEIAGPPID